jgi:hypothetical protein
LGHIELSAGDFVEQDEDGQYMVNEQKQVRSEALHHGNRSQAKGTLNYTCSFYPTYPVWDPDEDDKESDADTLSRKGSFMTSRTASVKGHSKTLSGASAAGTIPSLVPTESNTGSGEPDLAKQLEKTDSETPPLSQKKEIEKLRLTGDDLQQYGMQRDSPEPTDAYCELSGTLNT